MLTDLQQKAVQRIRFFQDELKKRGHFVRLAIEQEAVVTHDDRPAEDVLLFGAGEVALQARIAKINEKMELARKYQEHPEAFPPVDDAIRSSAIADSLSLFKISDYETAEKFLKEKEGLRSLTMLEREPASTYAPLQLYEAKFDTGNPLMSGMLTPLDVAMDTLAYKQKSLKRLLSESTCLSSRWAAKAGLLEPVFDAVPFPETMPEATMGLHANISVYDAQGKNRFVGEDGGESALMKQVGERLKQMHREGGLAYIQTPEALQRLLAKQLPKHISIGARKEDLTTIVSRHAVTVFNQQGEYSTRYLEDRLMGAHVDPLVVTAMELAAIYDVVCHPERQPASTTTTKTVGTATVTEETIHQLETTSLQPWVERFKQSTELKELLGAELYAGIMQAYGKSGAGIS